MSKIRFTKEQNWQRNFSMLTNGLQIGCKEHCIDSEYNLPGYVEALCGMYDVAEDCIKDIENNYEEPPSPR